jgi:pimeloyl-ACP methyl ester carboxylesterase
VTAGAVRAGTVEGSGLALAYAEQGGGEAVVLIHGTAVGRELWLEVVGVLGDELRSIAYDRRGYGDSEAPEPYSGTTVAEQAEDAAALIEALGAAPAVVCGHELGALVALDVLRRHPALVGAAVLVEPPLLALSNSGPAVVGSLREAIAKGAREGADPFAGAVDGYLREVAGAHAAVRLGRARLGRARSTGRPFAADLGAPPTFAFGRRELRELRLPVAVVAGARSALVRREVAEALAGMLGNATFREADSGHLVPLEAPEVVAETVRELAEP